MKYRFFRNTMAVSLFLCMGLSVTSCIEETEPKNNLMTETQVQNSNQSMQALANGIAGKLPTIGSTSSGSSFDIGYPGLGIIRDQMIDAMPINSTGYDYFSYWGSDTYLGGNYTTAYYPWNFYYNLAANCNILLRFQQTEDNKAYFGIAHFFRAWAYFDLARMYEYKETGIADLDNKATENGAYGITVPFLSEKTTEDESRNLPRLTVAQMYSQILSDLDKAQNMLQDYTRTKKNLPDVSVVYGEKARVYLDLATRLSNPTYLSTFLKEKQAFSASINTAEDCYKLAEAYADSAIAKSGCQILSETEWYGGASYTLGFNNINSNSWMLGSVLTKDNVTSSWKNFVSYMAPETTFGIAGVTLSGSTYSNTYQGQHLISSALYDKINANDWRKATWISKDDAGKKSAKSNYKTNMPDDMFTQLPALTGFKFRPVSGEMSDYSVGATAAYPLMRIEEMYFIKYEAMYNISASQSKAQSEFNTFMQTYRCNGKAFTASSTDFIEDLMTQKKIEFWGEGIMYFDYKRLNLDVNRSGAGNFPTAYQLDAVKKNTSEFYTPCWFNFYIPTKELGMNKGMTGHGNPDPSGYASKR